MRRKEYVHVVNVILCILSVYVFLRHVYKIEVYVNVFPGPLTSGSHI